MTGRCGCWVGCDGTGWWSCCWSCPTAASRVRAAWTDAQPSSGDDAGPVATLGSLADLLHVCELIAELRGQAAGMSPCKEDSHAAWPAQFDTRPGPGLEHRAGPGTA